MTSELRWHIIKQTLMFRGKLNRHTVVDLWKIRKSLLKGIHFMDVSKLERIDSAGVALLLHFCYFLHKSGDTLKITGVNDQLLTLINLYNLQDILPCVTRISNSRYFN